MDDTTLQRLRPAGETTADIAAAQARVFDETLRTRARRDELKAARPAMLLSATTAQLRENADAAADAESDLEQLAAIQAASDEAHKKAASAEAEGVLAEPFAECTAAIEATNAWYAQHYAKHANAIVDGIKLEAAAIQKIDALRRASNSAAGRLPEIAHAYLGKEWRSFSLLVKLPGIEHGPAIWWGSDPDAPRGEAAAYTRP